MKSTAERTCFSIPGIWILLALIGVAARIYMAFISGSPAQAAVGVGLVVCGIIIMTGFAIVQPNEAIVVTFFGSYMGAINSSGFYWLIPFSIRRSVSLRISNFISEKMKVNDSDGNPIEIAAVIVWQVANPTMAVLDVQDYGHFVRIQTETAVRKIASLYPYDAHNAEQHSLRGSTRDVCEALRQELQTHLNLAGIIVRDAQISHLAYAPEIAQAMLRRQQAQAVIAARMQIVDGAVGMVEAALRQLGEKQVVQLDEEKKAQMVSNLLVTLVSESSIQPILNTGSLY